MTNAAISVCSIPFYTYAAELVHSNGMSLQGSPQPPGDKNVAPIGGTRTRGISEENKLFAIVQEVATKAFETAYMGKVDTDDARPSPLEQYNFNTVKLR